MISLPCGRACSRRARAERGPRRRARSSRGTASPDSRCAGPARCRCALPPARARRAAPGRRGRGTGCALVRDRDAVELRRAVDAVGEVGEGAHVRELVGLLPALLRGEAPRVELRPRLHGRVLQRRLDVRVRVRVRAVEDQLLRQPAAGNELVDVRAPLARTRACRSRSSGPSSRRRSRRRAA